MRASLTKVLKNVENRLDRTVEVFLQDLSQHATDISPVDTGAYVTSHSIRTTRGAGRSRSSKDKPKGQDPTVKRREALNQLKEDIAALPRHPQKIFFTNQSPHVSFVENNPKYGTFAILRNVAPNLLIGAILKVRSRT
jgi:hypothetical protein